MSETTYSFSPHSLTLFFPPPLSPFNKVSKISPCDFPAWEAYFKVCFFPFVHVCLTPSRRGAKGQREQGEHRQGLEMCHVGDFARTLLPSLTLGRRVPAAAGGHFTPPLLVPGALQHPGVMLSQPQQQGGGSRAPTQPQGPPHR